MEIVVRRLAKPEEFHEVMNVQRSAWGMDWSEVVPYHVLKGVEDSGGMVLGAFAGNEMIGFSFGFLGLHEGRLYLHSHMTGVKEGWKYKGVGMMLKLKQREESLKAGLDLIMWTFEPLRRLNTYFNLCKLGAIFRRYYRNYYGMMGDRLNYGLESDRVKAEWWIKSKRVELKLAGKLRPPSLRELKELGGEVVLNERAELTHTASELALVYLPPDISEIKEKSLDEALRWRRALREVYEHYLSLGYVAIDMSEDYVILWRSGLDKILKGEMPWK